MALVLRQKWTGDEALQAPRLDHHTQMSRGLNVSRARSPDCRSGFLLHYPAAVLAFRPVDRAERERLIGERIALAWIQIAH